MPTDPERARDLSLQRIYGISLSDYKQILAAQGHKCPICLKPLSGISNPVDHDHKTGIVRGITCSFDNQRFIGRHTDWEKFHRAGLYLKDNPARRVIGSRQVPKKKAKRRNSAKPKGSVAF